MTSEDFEYEYFCSMKRPGERKSKLYSIEFFPSLSSNIFAACGGRKVNIFQIEEDKKFNAIRSFIDEDEKEDYYTCAWTLFQEKPFLCVGGESGIIKILNIDTCALSNFLIGHGGPIYELLFHPKDEDLIFSCGKDESIRLWSLSARRCVLVFAGDQGHRDAVLSIDVHFSGSWLASSGMDNTIKVWELDADAITNAITDCRAMDKKFKAPFIQFPAYTTRRVHTDYVDSVGFVGDLIMSKSIEDKCTLWKPDPRRRLNSVALLRNYPYSSGKLWFVKFGFNSDQRFMAIGADDGNIFLFNVDRGGESYQELKHPHMKSTQRCIRFSPDDMYLIGCCDDETIWCFKRNN